MDSIYTLQYIFNVSGTDTSISNYLQSSQTTPVTDYPVQGYFAVDYTSNQIVQSSYPQGSGSVAYDPNSDQYTVTFTYDQNGNVADITSYTFNYTGLSPYTFNSVNVHSTSFFAGTSKSETLSGTDEPVTPYTGVVVCFASGTRILTERGSIPVEWLQTDDLAITIGGERRPIRWLGQRTIRQPAFEQWPVRVSAGAFGGELPGRDLFLSPGHPVLVGADDNGTGGHLVPIMCLINGTTIARLAVNQVTYWHVELDHHDVLLAERLPAESYLDWGDRGFFTEGADHRLANPEFVVPGLTGRCRPKWRWKVLLSRPSVVGSMLCSLPTSPRTRPGRRSSTGTSAELPRPAQADARVS